MSRNSVNSIFREYSGEFMGKYHVSNYTKKIIRAIVDCRTSSLGGHIQKCDHCGHELTLYNSCRNRHCPLCQFMKKEEWIEKRKEDILPFQYFHVVFTLPDKLNDLVYRNKKIIFKLLFDKSKETLLSVSEDEKYFGAKIGFFSILHTWGQKLNLHPHVHCVVPGGGYNSKNNKWISSPHDYLVPVEVMKKRFRSIFLVGLKDLYDKKKLYLERTKYNDKLYFQKLIDELFLTEWVLYIKESFKSSENVIKYLSKYTHRIAISNHRIIESKNGNVTFSYKDYGDGNKKKTKTLTVIEFMRRFLIHIVPYKFVRIRYYGVLSNRTKNDMVSKCREYFKIKETKRKRREWFEIYKTVTGIDIFECQKCHIGQMIRYKTVNPNKERAGP